MKFVVNGGKKLKGEIRVSGSKNATTPILAATLLTSRPCVISNIPLIKDALTIIELLEHIGSKVEWLDKHTVRITNKNIDASHLPREMVRRLRSSILMIGPLLARFGKVKIHTPGGCYIGVRPMDAHFNAFRDLGFKVAYNETRDIYSITKGSKKKLKEITLSEFSVTATENLLMYGALNAPLTIKVGDTVTWKNQSTQANWVGSAMHPNHILYSGTTLQEHCPDVDNSDFDQCQADKNGDSWSFTFKKAGTWGYHNHMNVKHFGKIIVE